MKRIIKGIEPVQFSTWKSGKKTSGHPEWKRVPPDIKNIVHQSLLEEQGYICCYCERQIRESGSHTEHFRPKRFGDLQVDYANLLCSCERDLKAGVPYHCGVLKDDWFDENLLVSPLTENCEDRFLFTGSGEILPRQDEDEAATTTIARLGLNVEKLKAMRAKAIEALHDLSPAQIRQILANKVDDKYLPFHTTIRQVLA